MDMTNLHRSPPVNQSKTDLGIVNESQLLRFGITPSRGGLPEAGSNGRRNTGKPLFHISAQGEVARKLGRFGPAGRSIRMPLSSRRPIGHPAAVGGCIAIKLTGDCRASPSEAPPNLPHRMALRIEKCDLLALRK